MLAQPIQGAAQLLGEWSPVFKHFLDGYLQRLEGIEATVRERERLISLGRLAAGLAHEISNPAAAAIRATADLRAAVDWSYELLDHEERIVFRRLAVFAGTFSIEAADANARSPKSTPLTCSISWRAC